MLDARDCIVIPGFVDSHRHTRETVIRGIAPDVSLGGYLDIVLDQLAPAYRPEDVYAGNYGNPNTSLADWEPAREVGAPISVHAGMGPYAGRFSMV